MADALDGFDENTYMKIVYWIPISLLVFAGLFRAANADVSLPALFSEHAAMQKSAATPIWGRAEVGEKVEITLGSATAHTQADSNGRWSALLDLSKSEQGPFDLIVQGKNRLVVADVVVGRVWLCSGQSNMEYSMALVAHGAEEVAQSANPLLRHFKMEKNSPAMPTEELRGAWALASPQTTARFSAVAYFFGKRLQNHLREPIGLLNNSWGGSWAEAWTSAQALDTDAAFSEKKNRILDYLQQFPALQKSYIEVQRDWEKRYQREDKTGIDPKTFLAEGAPATDWKKIVLPARFAAVGLPSSGAIWLRKTVQITPDMIGHNVTLLLGVISGLDTAYFNGKQIGQTTIESPGSVSRLRLYSIPSSQLSVGPATITLRVFSQGDDGGFLSSAAQMRIGLLNISDEWEAKAECELPPLSAEAKKAQPRPPEAPSDPKGTPTLLFNGMLHPLLTYGLDGIIWYQGESNAGQASEYRRLFPLMIRDWRQRWGQGELPFYFCQLANHNPKSTTPGESSWAELREAQTMTLQLPNTAQAILIDLGEEQDIHPRNKAEVGERLARIALAKLYAQPIVSQGPVFRSMKEEGRALRLRFDHAEGGLVARALPLEYQPRSTAPKKVPLIRNSPHSEVEGFAICGADKKWVWAEARIDKEEVIVWSDQISHPIAVRYAWADNPTCNLYNTAGLPAGPFRTDDFPLTTARQK